METCRFWGPGGEHFAQRLAEQGISVQADETGYHATFPDRETLEAYLCEARAEADARVFFLPGV